MKILLGLLISTSVILISKSVGSDFQFMDLEQIALYNKLNEKSNISFKKEELTLETSSTSLNDNSITSETENNNKEYDEPDLIESVDSSSHIEPFYESEENTNDSSDDFLVTMTSLNPPYVKINPTGMRLDIVITNNSEFDVETGSEYTIEVFQENLWLTLPISMDIDDFLFLISPMESREFHIMLLPDQIDYKVGRYRVVKKVFTDGKAFALQTLFYVE